MGIHGALRRGDTHSSCGRLRRRGHDGGVCFQSDELCQCPFPGEEDSPQGDPPAAAAADRGTCGVVRALADNCRADIGHDPLVGQPVPPSTPRLRVSRRLAILLDDLVRIPGTKQGVGLDALLGLVPGVGDLVGSGISGAIMFDAVRARASVPLLAQMAWNLLLDAVLGLVPLVGDVVDVAHRANVRNYRLLEKAVAANPDPGPPTVGYVLAALALTVLPLLVTVALGVLALVLLFRWVSG